MNEKSKLSNAKEWRTWGPYLSDRQWGGVREDYSERGDAWQAVSHDMARSKAYRWGEEGIGGISDNEQYLCLALALWNGKDPILKERFFGLTNYEGNHGEDVKELYYYLDNIPSHSYMRMLYKYPQEAFPYNDLVKENHRRTRKEEEYEIIDTGVFNNDRYFDVFIEYAKNAEKDILIKYTVHNRGDADAPLHLLPTLWFRNTMEWQNSYSRPEISKQDAGTLLLKTQQIGDYYFYTEGAPSFLFTENETNYSRLYNIPNPSPFVKDGINQYLVEGDHASVNQSETGTKAAAWFQLQVPAKKSITVRMRLSNEANIHPFEKFTEIMELQQQMADEFYEEKTRTLGSDDEKNIFRQACSGMLWNKQFYYFNIEKWLNADEGRTPVAAIRKNGRNIEWKHLIAADVISMPDKWEFPWFAAWDLAFHCITLAEIDTDFAKKQLSLLLKDNYMHPNGQLPAYEWNFSDVNPPVHALATWKVYCRDREINGVADKRFLEQAFHKLMLNFTWWVNRKDHEENNIFEGGFLGLDNIGIFDRSEPLPGGDFLEQADGTSWMAVYSLNMMRMALELAISDSVYEDLASKFGKHFFYIAGAMANMSGMDGEGLWDDQDEFYYDVIKKPDGKVNRVRLRSIVGLIPLFAVEIIEESQWKQLPGFLADMFSFFKQRPDLALLVSRWEEKGGNNKHLLSLLRGHRMKCLLRRMLDETEFLSPYGIRSLSKVYKDHPFSLSLNSKYFSVTYNPAESDIDMFGGNSNWRGPVWMPLNYLIIQSLYRFQEYYTDDFKVEYPTNSGTYLSLREIADALAGRLKALFLKNADGARPGSGYNSKVQLDQHFKNHILFYEYFNGDTGKGMGASHQTGWTGLIANLK
ncbi:MAG: glucosidase [Chitinophagaceae bacterium]|nr:glucosidase [Chitinophagaceae bacterium]